MYSLLIVDDEKIIRDGLYELFSMEESLELNLFVAASGVEAQEILEQRKIDIVLTDIRMPRITGLELFEIIRERWPHSKVIFLTGYSEFDYVYQVQKHARYVLKAEDDSMIVEAVAEAIEELENDLLVEQIVQDTGRLKQRIFLNDLFNGFVDSSRLTADLFEKLDVPLSIHESMYLLVLRHGPIPEDNYEAQLRMLDELQGLLDKYFFDFMRGISFHYTKNFLVLLLQPIRHGSTEQTIVSLKGRSELFQRACRKNYNLSAAIAVAGDALPLSDILEEFQTVKARLLMRNEETLMVTGDFHSGHAETHGLKEQRENLIKSRLELLDYYFENSDKEHVIALLQEALQLFSGKSDMKDFFGVEVYSDISVKLIRFINRFHLFESVGRRIDVSSLYNVTRHENWLQAFGYLLNVAELVFEMNRAYRLRIDDDVVGRVKRYVQENLNGDTSLDTLAELVGLSPEYLLRLFRRSESVTILQYINDLKIIKAKNLISDRRMQIKEIAYELGFSSSGYFGRFFKSKTGLSPQSYREQNERGQDIESST